jgi:hypothetical protein
VSIPALQGKAQTVLGPVPPETLGKTSTHEHFLLDFTLRFKPPAEASQRYKAYEPVSMENLGWVRYNPLGNYDNLVATDEEVAISEAMLFKRAGGDTIVDTTSIGIARDPLALARISRATGINVVMGSGYYVDAVHPEGMDEKTEDQIAEEIVADITTGVGSTGIKSGIIGELGCSWPLTDNERKVLRAGARAQRETGASISIHPGWHEDEPFKILDLLEEAGADLTLDIELPTDQVVDPGFLRARKLTRELYGGYGRGCFSRYVFDIDEFCDNKDQVLEYTEPGSDHEDDFIYLSGPWRASEESLQYAPDGSGGEYEDYLLLKFTARTANAVLTPEVGGEPFKVLVTLDDQPLTEENKGQDVVFEDGQSYLLVDEPRLYSIVDAEEYGTYVLKMSSNSPHFALFAFTFGIYAQGI